MIIRRLRLVALGVLLIGLWSTVPVRAADPPDEGGGHGTPAQTEGEHQEGHGEGPSLFTGDLGNIFWTLLTFGLVIFVLGKFAWGPILTALQKREDFIRESLAKAKADYEAAEARLREYEEKLQTAREEATAIVEEGRRDAETVKVKIEQDARSEGEAMIERAKREIGLARDTAVKDLYNLTANLATDVAGRIISKELDATGHERLVAEAIDSLTRMPTQAGVGDR